jgi:arsenate reductase
MSEATPLAPAASPPPGKGHAAPGGGPAFAQPRPVRGEATAPSRGLWAGRLDALVAPVRRWLKMDDDGQVGLRVMEDVRRERYTQMRLLFVDVGNSARSQVAEAYAQMQGFYAESAGTFPSLRLQEEAIHVMKEQGLDISSWRPKPLDADRLSAFDRVIVMSDALPRPWGRQANVEHWNVLDPQGLPLDSYRTMRRDLERRIRQMARRHKVRPPGPGPETMETPITVERSAS